MENEVLSNNGILDIVVPIIPQNSLFTATIITVLVLMSVVFGFILWRMYMTPKGKARRRLVHLYQQSKQLSEAGNNTVYQIANIVKDGLELNCLSVNRIIPYRKLPQEHSWTLFVEKLDAARYSSELLSKDKLSQLMLDAKRWLR